MKYLFANTSFSSQLFRSGLYLILVFTIQSCTPTLTPLQKENKVEYQLGKIESKYPEAYQTVINKPDFGNSKISGNPTPENQLVIQESSQVTQLTLSDNGSNQDTIPVRSSSSAVEVQKGGEDRYVSIKDNLEKSIADSISIPSSAHYNNETIDFTIYSHGTILESNERHIFRITLEDSDGEYLINHLTLVRNDDFSGSFLLPEETITGTYILRCQDLNLGLEIFNQYFSIINLRTYREDLDKKECCPTLDPLKNVKTASKDPLEIRGHLRSENGQPVGGIPITFQSRGDTEEFRYTRTGENGEFRFNNPLYGNNEIYIKTTDRNPFIEIIDDSPYYNSSSGILNPYPLDARFIENIDLAQLVISYNYMAKSEITDELSDPLFYFDDVIIVDDYVPMLTSEETIMELVPYLKVKKSKKRGYSIHLLDFTDNMFHKGEPLILIDGFLVESVDQIFQLDVDDLEKISVVYNSFNNTGVIGEYGLYGLISVETRQGNYIPDEGLHLEVKGLLFNNLVTY